MGEEKKLDSFIQIRVTPSQKTKWQELLRQKSASANRKFSMTDLIISSVENKLLDSDRKEIMSFIEKQGNIFAKIENNINQVAKYVNTQKNISDSMLADYNSKLKELNSMKLEQNDLLRKIYKLLAK